MKIYGISGLGADQRVFDRLELNHDFIPIDWITPKVDETLSNYSKRLSEFINPKEEFIILGVSFGGLVAIEITKLLKPKVCILISSAEKKSDLPFIYRLLGKSRILKLIPAKLFDMPRVIAHFLFGTSNKIVLNSILDDTDLDFAKWAIIALCNWDNTKLLNNVFKISGSNDKILPPKIDSRTILIQGGEHFMIYDKAKVISAIINNTIIE